MSHTNPVTPFAMVREIVMKNADGREVTFTEASAEAEPAPGLYRLTAAAARIWPGAWQVESVSAQPLFPTPWGDAPPSRDDYLRRVDRMMRQAAEAGILGTEWLRHPPSGWLPVLEIAVAGLAALKARPENRMAILRLAQIKEKFGTLRVYVDATGSSEFRAAAAQIAMWAELCSENRCMLTGTPGTLRQGGWLMTLSDDAVRLRAADPGAFRARLYPE